MAAIAYLLTGIAMIFVARKISPVSWRAGLVVLALPLVFTGKALLLGELYGPVDLPYLWEPLASFGGPPEPIQNRSQTDAFTEMIPWRLVTWDAFRNGEWPLWNRFTLSGQILLAGVQASPFHPLILVAAALPDIEALTWLAAMTYLLAGLSMLAFLKEAGCGDASAIFGAAAWTFSNYNVYFLETALGLGVAATPLLFLGVIRLLRRSPEHDLASAVVLCSAFYLILIAGHPETALQAILFAAVFALIELFALTRGRTNEHDTSLRRKSALGIAAAALALLLSSVQLLPMLEALPQSEEYIVRTQTFVEQERSSSWQEVALLAPETFIPFVFGTATGEHARVPARFPADISGYAGALVVLFACVAVVFQRPRGTYFFLGAALFAFLTSARAPGLADVLHRIPMLNWTIFERFDFVVAFGVIYLAAHGFDHALQSSDRLKRAAVIAVSLAAVLSVAIAMLSPLMKSVGLSTQFIVARASYQVVPLLLVATLFVAAKNFRFLSMAVVAMLIVQRAAELGTFYPSVPKSAVYPPIPLFEGLPREELYRVVAAGEMMPPNVATHYGLEDARGFEAMTLGRMKATYPLWSVEMPVWFNRVDDVSRPFLAAMNVRYALVNRSYPTPPGWRVRSEWRNVRLLENPATLPRAFIPKQIRLGVPPWQEVSQMYVETDFGQRSWVSSPELVAAGARDETNGEGTVAIRYIRPDYELEVDARSPVWVIVSNSAWEGWRAFEGEKELPLAFGNHAFLALKVGEGKHRIRLEYRPASFTAGLAISALALIAFVVALARSRWDS